MMVGMMRIAFVLAAITLAGCPTTAEPTLGGDTGPLPGDAMVQNDAGPPDGADASTPQVDAFTDRPDAFSGTPDAFMDRPDASTGADVALGDVGCLLDAYEPNDMPTAATTADAPAIDTGATSYPMTWHDGDPADWITATVSSTGHVGMFRVHAWETDTHAIVEVRVTCDAGLVICRGIGAEQTGATCAASRTGDAFVDVACNTADPAAVHVLFGVTRGDAACEHVLAANITAAP